MNKSIFIICFFTFLIHLTESSVYCMRLAGIRTRRIAISMSFVTSALIVSRLSNMFQAPLLGSLVDKSVRLSPLTALPHLELTFRLVIFCGFLGSLLGSFLAPTSITLFSHTIRHFQNHGSMPRMILSAFKPSNIIRICKSFRAPKLAALKTISFTNIPKTFLIMNMLVTAIYTIGVLCSLLASAYLPDMRATANQLSGIVNGLATILLTLFVDPSGARITDEAFHNIRPENDVRSVVFGLQMGRLIGTLLIAQIFFMPFTKYIVWVTRLLN